MPERKETELYHPVKGLLEQSGYTVRSEVNGCDLVALKEGEEEPLIVELKRTFSMQLLYQGLDRLKLTSQVYVAVEHVPAKRGDARKLDNMRKLCRRLGFGLITVRFYSRKKPLVQILCEPEQYTVRPAKVKIQKLVHEFRERSGDYNVGGSTGRKLVTAYREKALHIAHLLKRAAVASPRELKALSGEPKTASILQTNVYRWFERVERGKYRLTASGEQALEEYAAVVSRYEDEVHGGD